MSFNILNALAKGAINLCALEEKDQYVLAVVTKAKTFVVPMIKTAKSAFAYIDDTKYGIEEYSTLSTIIDAINENKIYKGTYQFKPISKSAPEHSHVVVSFVKGGAAGTSAVVAKGINKILEKEGYTVLEKELATSFVKRDYSELMKDPANKAMFEQDAAELAKVDANYESLSLEVKVAHEEVETGKSSGIIFEGPTGTGKSFVARILANKDKAPLLNLQITYGTSIEDLVGMFIPNDGTVDIGIGKKLNEILESHSSDDTFNVDAVIAETESFLKSVGSTGKWKFVMGPLLKAFTYGYQIVIEEVNYGQPGIIAKLNEFTDGTLRVTINGRVYEKNPNFVVYMTMNPGYEGTETLNVALKNRFSKVNVPALTRKQFSERAMYYSKGLGHQLSTEFFGKLYDFSMFVEKEANSSKWHENVKFSIRNAQRLCNCILQKKRSFDEFFAAISIQYLNDLTTDNDNSDKLESFKKEKDIIEQIKSIYALYDFAESKVVEMADSLDEFFSEDSDDSTEKASHDDMVDDLLKRFEI